MNIRKLLEDGHAALAAEHAAGEAQKLGHPRIGSIGTVADGKVYGVCHRIALLRSQGIDKAIPLSQDIMFKAGEANEDTWTRLLNAGTDLKILRHDEVAVRAPIPGVPLEVLGHPDIVLQDASGKQFGLELKGIFGNTTAVSVFFENTPKNENLIQAAGYSYFRQIPYALCYTSASWIKLDSWDKKRYGVGNIKPFYRIFYMEWRDDVLWYRDETEEDWVQTVITPEGIKDYYRLVAEMAAKEELGPRVSADYVNGKPSKWGPQGNCSLCEFKSACDRYDRTNNYAQWIDDARAATEEEPTE